MCNTKCVYWLAWKETVSFVLLNLNVEGLWETELTDSIRASHMYLTYNASMCLYST